MRLLTFIFQVCNYLIFIVCIYIYAARYLRFEKTTNRGYLQDQYMKKLPALTFCIEEDERSFDERINEANQTDWIEKVAILLDDEIVENLTEIIKNQTLYSFDSYVKCLTININIGEFNVPFEYVDIRDGQGVF